VEAADLGLPAELGGGRLGVAALGVHVVHRLGQSAHLELAQPAVTPGHDAVHQDPVVAGQVGGLVRAPQHGQPEVAVEDERLDRAQPGGAVLADRGHQHHARLEQARPGDLGQPGLTTDQV
jgi:hypothetical protein